MIHGPSGTEVFGSSVQPDTRCAHYHSGLDIVAIRFKCCGRYYPCHRCHEEVAGHPPERWPATEFGEKAMLCGACGTVLSISEYLACQAKCPQCGAGFNPKCSLHYGLYFETAPQP